MRIATATVLAFAIAALPVALDRCAVSCEAHQDTVASTLSCHHPTSMATRIGKVPTPCGHDHSGSAVASAKSVAPNGRASLVAVETAPFPQLLGSASGRALPHASSRFSLAVDHRSLSLRI